ncbi:MAG: manganese efflux pump [Ruminococcus sp.]|nr:manganese efflux pump [Ruminococcus sp.]
MEIIELILLSVGLAMDAFAVSICKGLSVRELKPKHGLIAGAYFGGFQALMPLIGWLLGRQFEELIKSVDHWIAFGLLVLIGANMIRESFGGEDEQNASFSFKAMLPLAIATSIDALAVGVTFAFLEVNIVLAITLIGVITFAISAAGVKIGNVFGTRFKSKAEFAGGVILILLGIKILVEHLFFG